MEASRTGFDRDAFECDVLSSAGADGLWVINELRSRAKVASLEVPPSSMSYLLDRVVGRSTPLAKLAALAVEKREEEAKMRAVLTEIEGAK